MTIQDNLIVNPKKGLDYILETYNKKGFLDIGITPDVLFEDDIPDPLIKDLVSKLISKNCKIHMLNMGVSKSYMTSLCDTYDIKCNISTLSFLKADVILDKRSGLRETYSNLVYLYNKLKK